MKGKTKMEKDSKATALRENLKRRKIASKKKPSRKGEETDPLRQKPSNITK